MKKLYYIFVLLSSVVMLLNSCTREEENIFDQSAAERLNTAKADYRKVLVDAPDGWLVEYYAGKSSAKMGGYNLFASFKDDGTVTVASEVEPGIEITSLFDILTEQSIVLSFSTYNELIHMFSEPLGGPNSYFGDFEFIFTEVSNAKIVLKGKKWGNRIVMTRYNKAKDTWQKYIEDVNKVVESTVVFSNFKIFVDGTDVGRVYVDDYRSYEFVLDKTTFSENAIYTPAGIKFYLPVKIGDKEVENFSWDEDARIYTCTDNVGVTITLVAYVDPSYTFYEDFIGSYTLTYTNESSVKVDVPSTIEEKESGKTFTVKGFGTYELTAQYNKAYGTLSLLSQEIGASGSNTIWLASWDSKAGYVTWGTTVGMNSVKDTTYDGLKIRFADNGVWLSYTVQSYILWLLNSSGASAGAYTATRPYRFIEPIMVRN